tara:strand:- start:224 stop:484 length:261 start_codon:yes stop_codon:yes gene_type:complete
MYSFKTPSLSRVCNSLNKHSAINSKTTELEYSLSLYFFEKKLKVLKLSSAIETIRVRFDIENFGLISIAKLLLIGIKPIKPPATRI